MATIISGDKIVSPHRLAFRTGKKHGIEDIYYCTGSGIAIIDFKGVGNRWKRKTFNLKVPFQNNHIVPVEVDTGNGADYNLYKAQDWCVYCGLNSVYNGGDSLNSGFAVEKFRLEGSMIVHNTIGIVVTCACRGDDARLYRIGYNYQLEVYFDQYIYGT